MAHATLLMNNFIFYPAFVLLTALLYWPALWASFAFSGSRFSLIKFWGALIYTVLCASIHGFFLRDSTLPFMGYVDNSVMGWISLVMIFVYAFTLPVSWERKRWFSRK